MQKIVELENRSMLGRDSKKGGGKKEVSTL